MLSKRVWPVAVAGRRCTSHGTATYDRRTTPQDQLKSDSCSLGLLDRTPATDFNAKPRLRVQAIIVGTGGHFLIRLGSQNEWDGQRDRGPEDGTIVKGL